MIKLVMKKKSAFDSPEYETIILRLIEARQEAGLSQIDVAKIFKKTQSYVSKIETRYNQLDMTTFYKMAKLYKKEIASYFEML